MVKELGVKWARLHPNIFGTFGWSGVDSNRDGKDLDFSRQDAFVRLAQKNNIHLIVGISPLPTDEEWLRAKTYVPLNKQAYSAYVTRIVGRYDGDGKKDMPGLKYPIKYWQLENEPDSHNKIRRKWSRMDFSGPEEYFEVLRLTYRVIKKVDPEAKLMINLAGIGQDAGKTSFHYLKKLNRLGAGNYYDILSYHVYPGKLSHKTSLLKNTLENFKKLTQKPIWITESGINGELGKTEIEQAIWLLKHHVFHIANGVKKIS